MVPQPTRAVDRGETQQLHVLALRFSLAGGSRELLDRSWWDPLGGAPANQSHCPTFGALGSPGASSLSLWRGPNRVAGVFALFAARLEYPPRRGTGRVYLSHACPSPARLRWPARRVEHCDRFVVRRS